MYMELRQEVLAVTIIPKTNAGSHLFSSFGVTSAGSRTSSEQGSCVFCSEIWVGCPSVLAFTRLSIHVI